MDDTVRSTSTVIPARMPRTTDASTSVKPRCAARRRSPLDIDLLLVPGVVQRLRRPVGLDAEQVVALGEGGGGRRPRERLVPRAGVGEGLQGVADPGGEQRQDAGLRLRL